MYQKTHSVTSIKRYITIVTIIVMLLFTLNFMFKDKALGSSSSKAANDPDYVSTIGTPIASTQNTNLCSYYNLPIQEEVYFVSCGGFL